MSKHRPPTPDASDGSVVPKLPEWMYQAYDRATKAMMRQRGKAWKKYRRGTDGKDRAAK